MTDYPLFQAFKLAAAGKVRGIDVSDCEAALESHKLSAQTAQSATDGSVFIPTRVLMDSIVPELGSTSVTQRLGARVVAGLRDNVSIPRVATAPTPAYLDSEAAQAAAIQAATFQAITPHPRLLVAAVRMTWGFASLPPAAGEAVIRGVLKRQFGVQMDHKALNGTGVDKQPTGLAVLPTTTGINVVDFTSATYTGATADVGYLLQRMVGLVLEDGAQDADSRIAYVGEPAIFSKLAKAIDSAGQPLFPRALVDLAGVPVAWSPLARAALGTNGTTDARLFAGDFRRLSHFLWGDLSLRTVEIGDDALQGAVHVVAHVGHDAVIERPQAFTRAANFSAALS